MNQWDAFNQYEKEQRQKRLAKEQQLAEEKKRKEEESLARMQRQVEELRIQNQERGAAQQEAHDKLNQRIQQAYQGWESVPEGLFTKTQLAKKGLHLPEGVKPVAEVHAYRPGKQRGYAFYDLYRLEDTVSTNENTSFPSIVPSLEELS